MQKILGIFLLLFLGIILIAGGVLFVQRKNTPQYEINISEQTVIKEISALNRLETASFTIEKVIDAGTSGNTFEEILFGDRILLIAHGQVIAGIDLSRLNSDDISINGDTIRLSLPAPEILVTNLDNDQSRVYDRRQGLLTKGDSNLESAARRAAEETIQDAACQGGILNEASTNAQKQLTALLKAFQFVTVIIDIPQGTCE